MSKSTCVVLGGTGFLGRQLCAELVRQQYSVRSIPRSGVPAGKPEKWWADVIIGFQDITCYVDVVVSPRTQSFAEAELESSF